MKSFLDKIFLRSNNLDYISESIKNLTQKTPAQKIFYAINFYSSESEIRYVGGCIRKIINKEKVDDIDLATNLEPSEVCKALKKNNINYYESGIEHGTITAVIDKYKFEITTLRKDIQTDGRHAKIEFSKDWKEDAFRRDFTINAIYSDKDGNLFDPFNGKIDLILMLFPELKNIKIFSKLSSNNKDLLKEKDFIFLISLMIIDGTDNADYFLYKFNISKKDQKRIKDIDNFYKEKINFKTFTENNMNKIFYYYGKETALDILNHRKIKSKKVDNSLNELIKHFENKETPFMPVNADFLMKKYKIPAGKNLGDKLRLIEEKWVKNNFKISNEQVDSIVKN